jgi:hypothetical protein
MALPPFLADSNIDDKKMPRFFCHQSSCRFSCGPRQLKAGSSG